MSDVNISCDGVRKLLESLDPSKALRPDSIPTKILRVYAKEALTVIFMQSLTTGKLPDSWLKANKKGDKSDANNYHLISLTSACCN